MAYVYARKTGRVEIREARVTPRGPRSRTLVSFQGPLTEAHLERADAASAQGIDRAALRQRALELGVPVAPDVVEAPARDLLAGLRRGARLDSHTATLLREALAPHASEALPDALSDVAEWVGASDAERGRALREVLRLYDTIVRSREPVPTPDTARFPHFDLLPLPKAS
ncbi:MAG: hypothetical protein AAF430_11460 [Myxococcota bacterium]